MTTAASATNTASMAVATGNAAAAKNSMDFNMFLKMLTTQMQNQDPLDPMDTSEYTAQLVQYSQVEQSIQQTGTLKDILSRLTTQDMAQASGFIGREGQFAFATSGLSATRPASWGYTAPRPLADLTATIKDEAGAVIDTRKVDAGGTTGGLTWDGRLPNGTQAAPGAYTVSFAGTDRAGAVVPVVVTSHGIVDEVVTTAGVVSLGINGIQIPAAALMRVSQAG